VRLVAWNILHGGGTRRTPLIALRLCDLAPDLVVLTEHRRATGGQIAGVLFDRGLTHQISTNPAPARNGVFVASRWPLQPAEPAPTPWAAHRWLDLGIPALDACLTAVHAPDTHRSDAARIQRQAAYWQHLVRICRERAGMRHLIAGDLNTGRHRLDEAGSTFTGTEFLGRFSALGYRDAFRLHDPAGAAPTWHSHTGSGFRIDAVWVSAPLSVAVKHARHDAAALGEKESDHAPVVVDLTLAEGVERGGPGPDPQKTLEKKGFAPLPARESAGKTAR
jgi:exonuclease III